MPPTGCSCKKGGARLKEGGGGEKGRLLKRRGEVV